MADMVHAAAPHAGRRFANSDVSIEAILPVSRISLRVAKKNAAKLTKPLGFKLPAAPKSTNSKGARSALWLGPDEWLVFAENDTDAANIMTKLDKLDCSAVDISQRNTAIAVSGPGVQNLLSAGCPQNLSLDAFPVGACSRTVFGKVEIILWRKQEEVFQIEVWRSFSDYLWTFLQEAAKDAGI